MFNSHIFKNRKDIINQYYEILVEEAEKIKENVAKDKDWLERQPILQDFLNKLQFLLQEKNIAFFSQLITALVNDVINDVSENEKQVIDDIAKITAKEINFDLYIKGGIPALKINAKSNNNIEKITSGGLKNVIATGLRVLALWRLTSNLDANTHHGALQHRKFLFLDEPDCWIAQSSMPHYAKLLHQLAEHFHLQILMVTHHDVEYFKPYARVYRIQNNNGLVQVNLISDITQKDNHTQDYIESVHLKNFKAYKDNLIELSPKLTVIVGKSDSGKSVLTEAFNAIINNQSDDDVIRHNENKASVVLNFDKKYSILWERVRKIGGEYPQKVRYRLYERDIQDLKILNDEFDSYRPPEFASSALKMKKIDDIDIHLGLQEDMTFLFNPKISDQERAKVLSLGKESSYINAMIENLRSKTRDIKSEVKINEKRYNNILLNLTKLVEIDKDNHEYEKMVIFEDVLKNHETFLLHIDNLVKDILSITNIASMNQIELSTSIEIDFNDLKNINQILDYIDNIPQINKIDTSNLHEFLIIDLSQMDNILSTPKLDIQPIPLINEFNLFDFTLIDEILKCENLFHSYISIPDDNNMLFHDIGAIDKLGIEIKQIREKIKEQNEELLSLNETINSLQSEIKKLEEQMKTCPTCGQAFEHKH